MPHFLHEFDKYFICEVSGPNEGKKHQNVVLITAQVSFLSEKDQIYTVFLEAIRVSIFYQKSPSRISVLTAKMSQCKHGNAFYQLL